MKSLSVTIQLRATEQHVPLIQELRGCEGERISNEVEDPQQEQALSPRPLVCLAANKLSVLCGLLKR